MKNAKNIAVAFIAAPLCFVLIPSTTFAAGGRTPAISATTAASASPAQPAQVSAPVAASAKRSSIKVTKCFTNATRTAGGQMLIKASSSNPSARLFAYRPNGSLIGEVRNGGGSRYGGTVMPYQHYDPIYVTIKSSAGGSITVRTTPFQATA